jgi:hypothetical protein
MALKFGDRQLAARRPCRVVDVETAADVVVERKGHREQAALAPAQDQIRDIEERRRQNHTVADDPDRPALLDDENAVRVTRRSRHEDRRRKAADRGECERAARRRGAAAGESGEGSQRSHGHEGQSPPPHNQKDIRFH